MKDTRREGTLLRLGMIEEGTRMVRFQHAGCIAQNLYKKIFSNETQTRNPPKNRPLQIKTRPALQRTLRALHPKTTPIQQLFDSE